MASRVAQQHAQAHVVMIAAGVPHDEVVAMAKTHGVKPVHLDQLAVPEEQDAARRLLIHLLKER